MTNTKLPPLGREAFEHGETEKHELADSRCSHKAVAIISSTEIKCPTCSSGWTGPQVTSLYHAILAQGK